MHLSVLGPVINLMKDRDFRRKRYPSQNRCLTDGFGESGRTSSGDEGAVSPNANLQITLELVSWKAVSDVTNDKKVLKKIIK